MKLKPTIRETVVGQVEKDNLYYENLYGFLGVGDDDDIPDYDWVHDYDQHKAYWKDNDHISIEMLQAAVDEMKSMGATHVQIYPHGDHQSYYFTGVKLELVGFKDVLERQKKKLETSIINDEIALKYEEEELQKKRENLQAQKDELENL